MSTRSNPEPDPHPDRTAINWIVRYVLLPMVFALGLHGLVHYALIGEGAIRPDVTVMP